MKELINIDEILLNKDFKAYTNDYFGWIDTDENSSYLHLGKIKKAVIIRKSITGIWFISEGSFFPFNKEIYTEKFKDKLIAKKVASDYIREWLEQLNYSLKIN